MYRVSARQGLWVKVLLLLLGISHFPILVSAQSVPLKRPLTHADYDSWRSIQGQQLSRDGKFLAYTLAPAEGDGEFIVRNLATGTEWRVPRGSRPESPTTPSTTPSPGAPGRLGRGAFAGGGSNTRAAFSADSRYVIFSFSQLKAAVDQAKKDKKKPEEMPKSGIAVMDLTNGNVVHRFEGAKSFQVPENNGLFLAYQMEAKPEAGAKDPAKEEQKPAANDWVARAEPRPESGSQTEFGNHGVEIGNEGVKPDQRPGGRRPSGTSREPRKQFGSDLVILNLANKTSRTIPEVAEFSFSKDGTILLYTVSSKKEETNGLYALIPSTDGPPATLLAGKGKYSKFTWDEKQTQLAFLSDHSNGGEEKPKMRVYHWDRQRIQSAAAGWQNTICLSVIGGPGFSNPNLVGWALPSLQSAMATRATELISPECPDFRTGFVISDRGTLNFSPDGTRLFLSAGRLVSGVSKEGASSERSEARGQRSEGKEESNSQTPDPESQTATFDLWHWKDDFIQPMQKVRAEQERNRAFRAVYHLQEKKFCQLADETLADVTPANDCQWAIGYDDRPYRIMVGYDGNYTDAYLVNTLSGARTALLKKHQGTLTLSPSGKYALSYDGKHWNCMCLPAGKPINLTANLPVSFAFEDYDSPSPPPSYGNAGWTSDEKYVLLYDRYDIWLAPTDGSKARNLTAGVGRKEKTQFRYVRLDPQEKAIDPAKPLLLRAEQEWSRDAGFYRVRLDCRSGVPPDSDPPEKLIMQARSLGTPTRAKDADVLLFTASSFYDNPDLYVTTSDFKELKRVTDANPQKANLIWGKAELIRYKNLNGVQLSGILIKPENFDPNKKYPMLVYIYEKLSQNLHRFVDPRPGTSINASYYASNGYLVFMPDIVYTIGYPGQSALKCVLPGIQAVVDKGFVNENAIGIQGHSWGGYQIAYMITQTNRFKAVAAGAPVSNMTSAYSGIRWGSGLPRQFQYERTQSRIGGTLWQYPMRFVENSPVFMADRVQTPLLMLHNDQDDAVPWYQGIEYFLALRRLGKEVYMFNYNGELHGLRKKANQKDYTMRMQQFFDHHLKGAPKPDWMAKGIPFLDRDKEKEKTKTATTGG
jgi:dipeptidyl aminopeptidase/acylaminoacyl peptidase